MQNEPKISHEIPVQGTASISKPLSTKELIVCLQQEDAEPWQVGTSNEEEVRTELSDNIHDIPKYTVVVNSALEFTVFVFNWPVPDENPIYKENKLSLMHVDAVDLLKALEFVKGWQRICMSCPLLLTPLEDQTQALPQSFAILCQNPLESKTITSKYFFLTRKLVARFPLALNIQRICAKCVCVL